jgi:hypothetical protein
MKLSTAFLMLAPAAAFTPGANFNRGLSPLSMAKTEAATETKVRHYHYHYYYSVGRRLLLTKP